MATKISKSKKQRSLEIKDVLKAVDERNYDFYSGLDEKQIKEFSPYVLMRYTSNVSSEQDIQEWFLERTNEMVNKNHWVLSKNHKELLWKLYAGTGIGSSVFHPYLPSLKVELNKIEKLIAELYPAMKTEDIKLMSSMMTDEDKQELFDKMGFDKEQRKSYE